MHAVRAKILFQHMSWGVLSVWICGGLSKSLYLAKYYLEEAVGMGVDKAYCPLAVTLLKLGDLQYKAMNNIPGHCCIPRVLFWARKAAAYVRFKADAINVIEESERFVKQRCANCERDAGCFSEKNESMCTRCKAAWHCGRECQLKHWKDGHKTDCIKQK